MRGYDTEEELLAAESNGFVVVGFTSRVDGVPAIVGPYPNREEANKARSRLRARRAREEAPAKVRTSVRVLWKDGYDRA